MEKKPTASEILSRWPSRRAVADDLGKKPVVVHRWHQRQGIPQKYHAALLDAASRRNIPLNWRELLDHRSEPVTP